MTKYIIYDIVSRSLRRVIRMRRSLKIASLLLVLLLILVGLEYAGRWEAEERKRQGMARCPKTFHLYWTDRLSAEGLAHWCKKQGGQR